MSPPRRPPRVWLTHVLLFIASSACGELPTLTVVGHEKTVVADDGYELTTLALGLEGSPLDGTPRAWMFYLVGSEPVAVRESTAQFADLVAQGLRVVLLQPRGVAYDGRVDRDVFFQHDTRQRRLADQRAVLDAYLTDDEAVPVLLVGISQGGIIAADLASSDERVTHLLMLGSGGGWTQAEEMRFLVERHPDALGGIDDAALEARFEAIRANPDSGELWAGHPYRMWSSYLWHRPLQLASSSAAIFVAHGDADEAVPVESARALRDALSTAGFAQLTYREYPGLDHSFADANGESRLLDVQQDAFAWMSATGLLEARE